MIFDRLGTIRYASDPRLAQAHYDRSASPTCQICHAKPPAERSSSALLDLDGGTTMRNVIPIRNREPCHRCHSPVHRINGVLIIDTAVDELKARLASDVWTMVAGVGVLGVLLPLGIYAILRRLILRPLRRLEQKARAIAAGDFGERAQELGAGPVARLGREFNAMARSVSGLLLELRRQRAQLENVMNGVDDGLLVIDESFTVVAANKSLGERLGAPPEELLGRPCHSIWGEHGECARDRPCGACPGARAFAAATLQTALRARRDRQSGEERHDEIFASPIFGERGQVVQVAEVWRDITERRRHEARMAEVQRFASLGMLASSFSHELNTPLGTMLFCVEDVRRALGDRTDALAQADLIRGEILRCRQITQQFLSLSRGHGESPKADLLDPAQAIRSAVPLVEPTARQTDVRLEVEEASAPPPVVLANKGAVQQVLLNLLLNAVQASKPGDVVRVALAVDTMVRVKVIDTGAGIAAEAQARIFEPFVSASPGGTGLGLFVARSFARQWGGDIRVASELGSGATFEVTFPRQDET